MRCYLRFQKNLLINFTRELHNISSKFRPLTAILRAWLWFLLVGFVPQRIWIKNLLGLHCVAANLERFYVIYLGEKRRELKRILKLVGSSGYFFFTPKLITCFIDEFHFENESQSFVYLLNGSEHIYGILDLRDEMHSIWDLWRNGLQECKASGFFEVGRGGQKFSVGPRKSRWAAAPARVYLPRELGGGYRPPICRHK